MNSIQKSKWNMPILKGYAVGRAMIYSRLDESISQGYTATLVSAPPGYGKTMAVSGWLGQQAMQCAWLTLDDGDNDPIRFYMDVSAAINKAAPSVTGSIPETAGLNTFSGGEWAASALLDEIQRLQQKVILVMDDLHTIASHEIFGILRMIVDSRPAMIHLIFLTREDPALPIARWRVKKQLAELRESALRFEFDEACQFLKGMDVDLPRRDVEILQNRTEGWAAGLYLAGLALRDMDNRQRQSFIGAFQGTQKYIIDYLVEEVLALADEGLSRFLCQTAAADRLNGDLCNALTGRQDSAELLVQLEKRNFFIFPLDENRQWYRYHSLFRDILRSELSAANKRELHQKAAYWLEENGFAEEAVKQAEAAGDYDHAILLLSRIAPRLIRDGELNTLLIRLNELPEHVRFSDTSLVISHAWCLMLTGKPREAAHLVSRIQKEKLALTASDSIAMLNVLLLYLQVSCHADFVFSLKQAVEQLLEEKAELKSYHMHAAAQRLMMQGKIQEAELKFMEAYHQARLDHQFHIALLSAKDAAMTLLVLGRKRECDRFCKQVVNRCGSEGTLAAPLASMVYLPMAASSLAGNNLSEALRFMEEALPVYRQMSMEYLVIQAEHQLAAILHASNRTAEALIMISDVAESLKELDFEQAMGFTKAVEAEFLLADGKTSLAMQWMQSIMAQVDSPISQANERQAFAYAKILIACLRYDEARRLLARLETALTEGGRNYRLVTVYLMQSILFHRQNQHASSAERMEKALSLAADEGLFRPFLDEGQDMHGILKGITTSWPDFAGKILDMSTADSIKPQASARNGQESVKWAALQENLSEREIEVLRLASGGCSNQDIARTLYITLGTVKWHMNNIFSKLGTSRRTQAIAKARELNLL